MPGDKADKQVGVEVEVEVNFLRFPNHILYMIVSRGRYTEREEILPSTVTEMLHAAPINAQHHITQRTTTQCTTPQDDIT